MREFGNFQIVNLGMFSVSSIIVLDAIEKEVDRQMVKNAIVAVSEMFMRQFKKEVNTKLKESFEFEDVRSYFD